MSDLGHVLILAGGLSPEREVSLRSGARLRDALREAGVDADTADADAGLIPAVIADPPSAVYPAIHGASGEDGSIQEVLTLLGVPYVGALPDACRFAFDKPTAKAIARAAGLATPASVTLPRGARPSGAPPSGARPPAQEKGHRPGSAHGPDRSIHGLPRGRSVPRRGVSHQDAGPPAGPVRSAGPALPGSPARSAPNVARISVSASTTSASRRIPSRIRAGSGKQ